MEKEHRYKDGNRRWRLVMLWETVLEEDEAGSWPVHELGIIQTGMRR